jgi:hypothetical protein
MKPTSAYETTAVTVIIAILHNLKERYIRRNETLTVILWAISVSVTSPGLKTRESVSQTVLEAGGLAQNSTVRDRRWPVVAVNVLLAGYTSGRPGRGPELLRSDFSDRALYLNRFFCSPISFAICTST